jgi:predicted Co/Zn/Cd cation transporter (cation efflux family)
MGAREEITSFDTIHNYHERLVYGEVLRVAAVRNQGGSVDPRMLADVACVALNRLPPRYIRHDVDYAFYVTPAEREQQAHAIADAVAQAWAYVTSSTARKVT